MSARTRVRGGIAALAMVATAVGLTGCGGDEVRVAQPAAKEGAQPLVAVPQATSILDAVDAALVKGVQGGTVQAYDGRISGPYKQITAARIKVEKDRKVKPAAPPAVQRLRLLVPTGTDWPRFFVAVGNAEGQATPVLRVLSSPNPRAPYALWSELTMLPGATLPEVAPAVTGAAQLALDDDALGRTPKDVLGSFAGYLTRQGKGPEAAQFERNAYTDQLVARLGAHRKTVDKVATISSTHWMDPEAAYAMRTADGGAILVGAFRQRYTLTVRKGKGTITVDPTLAALAGKKSFSTAFTRMSVETVALRVPPGGKGPVTVIAAQKGDVGAVVK